MGKYDSSKISGLIYKMRSIQSSFTLEYGVTDIWSNSKIFEILIANTLHHDLIPGHSGTLDAKDSTGNEYEYKHFKQSSSNHSWTFNDFSETTIQKLNDQVHQVIFAHIEDANPTPAMDFAFVVDGSQVSNYLSQYTESIANHRKMINVSPNQIRNRLGINETTYNQTLEDGPYGPLLQDIFTTSWELERVVGVNNILTSNKLWEVIVSLPLGHQVNSEQGGRAGAHDAQDESGGEYEYKVSSSSSWNFQDISENVLAKYLNCEAIILATVNKENLMVESIWTVEPSAIVNRLMEKLSEKNERYQARGKSVRRLQASITKGDLLFTNAERII